MTFMSKQYRPMKKQISYNYYYLVVAQEVCDSANNSNLTWLKNVNYIRDPIKEKTIVLESTQELQRCHGTLNQENIKEFPTYEKLETYKM
jgi:hypothetical protein